MIEQIPFKYPEGMIKDIQEDIWWELQEAEGKFPGWPTDPVHGTAIVDEEAGEALKAALEWYYEDGSQEELDKELVQTAAMALRMLLWVRTQDWVKA